jgi:hypothetical protein
MSKILFFTFFILISCGEIPQKAPGTVGEIKKYEPVSISFEDNERVQAICRALASKEDLLDILVSTGAEYNFSYAQKGCNDEKISAPKPVVALIENKNGNYIYKTKNGEEFGFTNVDTFSKGVMASICQGKNLMSPMLISSTSAMWFTTYTASESCASDLNGLCIHIQRGSLKDGINYEIHTNEWIKIKLANEKRGFFMERSFISQVSCSDKKTIQRRAVLN